MNRIFKKSLAVITAAALVFTLGANAFAATSATMGSAAGGTIALTATIQTGTFNLVVPAGTALGFVIDPYSLGTDAEDDYNIYGPAYPIYNLGDTNVRVEMIPFLVTGTGVTQLPDADVLSYANDPNNVAKVFSLDIWVADEFDFADIADVDFTAADGSADNPGTDSPNVADVKVTPVKGTGTAADAKMVFALAASETTAGTAPEDETGITAFTVRGNVNANAAWTAADIKPSFKISLKAVSEATYTEIYSDLVAGTALNSACLIETAPATTAVLPLAAPTFDTVESATESGTGTAAAVTIKTTSLGTGLPATAVVSVSVQTGTNGAVVLPTTCYSFAAATGLKLNVGAAAFTGLGLDNGDYKVIVKFNDGLNSVVEIADLLTVNGTSITKKGAV